MEKIKVLFITGSGRSGSTLLEKILGQVSCFFPAGELRYIWRRSFRDNQLCGCGSPFNDCDVWQRIVKKAFDSPENIFRNINSIIDLQDSLDRMRYMPFIEFKMFNKVLKSFGEELLYPLYSAILEESGKKLIIDSSKHPSYLGILSRCDFVELYIVHLIRDSRGVAYSWSKNKIRPDITSGTEYMPKFPPVTSAFHWMIYNYLARSFSKTNKYLQIRYEDFISNPVETSEDILKFVSMEDDLSFFVNKNKVSVGINHTVSGNPMRFKTGELKLKLDLEWKDRMAPRDNLLVSLITYPIMRKLYR